jgi:DUF971 family protein
MAAPPVGIHVIRGERIVEITWGPGHVGRYPIRMLRCACACAGCVDEFTGRRTLDPTSVPGDISITSAAMVGNYAVRFAFTDGHDTGIYTFERLAQLCPCDRCRSTSPGPTERPPAS